MGNRVDLKYLTEKQAKGLPTTLYVWPDDVDSDEEQTFSCAKTAADVVKDHELVGDQGVVGPVGVYRLVEVGEISARVEYKRHINFRRQR